MKITFFVMAALSVSFVSCGQDIPANKVPSVVQNAVQSNFPDATKIDWEKVGADFKADLEVQRKDHEILISPAGKVIAHKTDILPTELPEAITAAIARDYAAFTIDDADNVERDGVTYFQVELDAKGQKDKHIVYGADGVVAKNISFFE